MAAREMLRKGSVRICLSCRQDLSFLFLRRLSPDSVHHPGGKALRGRRQIPGGHAAHRLHGLPKGPALLAGIHMGTELGLFLGGDLFVHGRHDQFFKISVIGHLSAPPFLSFDGAAPEKFPFSASKTHSFFRALFSRDFTVPTSSRSSFASSS